MEVKCDLDLVMYESVIKNPDIYLSDIGVHISLTTPHTNSSCMMDVQLKATTPRAGKRIRETQFSKTGKPPC